jgi:DNA-binding LacI/PurR family transcriptional regulator
MALGSQSVTIQQVADLAQVANSRAEHMLRSKLPPTAIFASNDDTAAAAISVARRIGLRLPEQLSVVGFDDAPLILRNSTAPPAPSHVS